MPWTVADVDKHKKGLTDKQKEQWVKVANSALKACQEKGGKDCDASAIRQANGVVGNNMRIVSVQANNYQLRTEIHQGRSHLVAPVVMLNEGVLNGSAGPLLHLAEQFGKFPGAWNGIPIFIDHPRDGDVFVAGNTPQIIDQKAVGRVYNAYIDGAKLKGEAWIDEKKIEQLSPVALGYIRQGRPLDVSVGVWTDDEPTAGTYNNTAYEAIAKNHRPDHLALLPGGEGACSWADGCGIRANAQGGDNKMGDKNNKCPACVEKAGILLNSKHTSFTEQDREWLEGLGEAYLDKLIVMQKKADEPPKKVEPPQVNKDQAIQVLKDELKTPEQFIGLLPAEFQDQMRSGLRLHEEKRTGLIEAITAYENNKFSKDELTAMTMDELAKIAALIPGQADYSANGGGPALKAHNTQAPLCPPGVEEDKGGDK